MPRKKLAEYLKRPRQGATPGTPEWTAWVQEIEEYLGHPICAAGPGRNRAYPCPKPQAMGTRRCTSHGAKTPTGRANHQYKHGRNSVLLKKAAREHREAFKASLEDPAQMELRAELAMLDARLAQLWGNLHRGASEDAWEAMRGLVGDLALALAEDDTDEVHRVVTTMTATVDAHFDDKATWTEIRKTAQLRGRLAGEERKRQQVLQGFIQVQRLNFILMFLADSIVQHVGDHPGVHLVLQDVKRLNPSNGIVGSLLDPEKEIVQ